MTTVVYPALVSGSRDQGYVARFADLDGCTAQAVTQGELLAAAREALQKRLEQLTLDGKDWPEASELSGLSSHPEATSGGALLVDVDIEDVPMRVNISIGERLLKRIDQGAEGRGMTRSAFIAHASRQALGEGPSLQWDSRKVQETLTDYGRVLNEKFGADSEFSKGISELERKLTRSAEVLGQQLAEAWRSKPAPTYRATHEAKADDEPVQPA